MTEEEMIGTLAAVVEPEIGRYLAELAAQRLAEELEKVDGGVEALADLVAGYINLSPLRLCNSRRSGKLALTFVPSRGILEAYIVV